MKMGISEDYSKIKVLKLFEKSELVLIADGRGRPTHWWVFFWFGGDIEWWGHRCRFMHVHIARFCFIFLWVARMFKHHLKTFFHLGPPSL